MAPYAPPRAVPRAPAPRSRNSADVVPKPVLSFWLGLPPVGISCARRATGRAKKIMSVRARPAASIFFIGTVSRRWDRTEVPSLCWLLRKVHHCEAAQLPRSSRFHMPEVHPASHDLVVAILEIPVSFAALGGAGG